MKNLISGFVILLSFTFTYAQEVQGIQSAVNTFVASLNSQEKKKCSFDITDEERYNWNFVPTSRKGIALKELDAKQSQLFAKILQTALSNQGYEKGFFDYAIGECAQGA